MKVWVEGLCPKGPPKAPKGPKRPPEEPHKWAKAGQTVALVLQPRHMAQYKSMSVVMDMQAMYIGGEAEQPGIIQEPPRCGPATDQNTNIAPLQTRRLQ